MVIVFDFDETIVHCKNIEAEKQSLFLNLDNVEIIPSAFKIFNKLRKSYEIFILTNRHPLLKAQIAGMTGIKEDHVICRDYCLTNEEMKLVNVDEKSEEVFLQDMAKYKINTLKKIQENANSVIVFFDDMAERMKDVSKKVRVFYPISKMSEFRKIKLEINAEYYGKILRMGSITGLLLGLTDTFSITIKAILTIISLIVFVSSNYCLEFALGHKKHVFLDDCYNSRCPICNEFIFQENGIFLKKYHCDKCNFEHTEFTLQHIKYKITNLQRIININIKSWLGICIHQGCKSKKVENYQFLKRTYKICNKHAIDEGFCPGCHQFKEPDEFEESVYCNNCLDEFRLNDIEEAIFSEEDDFFDEPKLSEEEELEAKRREVLEKSE
jgi:hypothetical protein